MWVSCLIFGGRSLCDFWRESRLECAHATRSTLPRKLVPGVMKCVAYVDPGRIQSYVSVSLKHTPAHKRAIALSPALRTRRVCVHARRACVPCVHACRACVRVCTSETHGAAHKAARAVVRPSFPAQIRRTPFPSPRALLPAKTHKRDASLETSRRRRLRRWFFSFCAGVVVGGGGQQGALLLVCGDGHQGDSTYWSTRRK